jgi:glycosyltransferase involved in cell wall biosynthesis
VFFVPLFQRLEQSFQIEFNILAPSDPDLVAWDPRVTTFDVPVGFAYEGQMHKKMFRSPIKGLLWILAYLKNGERMTLELCRAQKPDVIWVHWLMPSGIVAYRASRKTGIPYMLASHGTDIFLLRKYPLLYQFFKRVTRSAAQWSVVSRAMAAIVHTFEPKVTPVIRPLGYNDKVFVEHTEVTRDPNLIIAAGSIIKRKNFDIVVAAVASLRAKGVPVRLVILGEGPEKDRLIAQQRRLNASAYVEILPACTQEQLAVWFSRARAFVMPSVDEGLGMVYIEAMACGCPGIGVRQDGTVDVIQHRANGLLVETPDVEQVASAIEEIHRDSALWESLHLSTLTSVNRFASLAVENIGNDLRRCASSVKR